MMSECIPLSLGCSGSLVSLCPSSLFLFCRSSLCSGIGRVISPRKTSRSHSRCQQQECSPTQAHSSWGRAATCSTAQEERAGQPSITTSRLPCGAWAASLLHVPRPHHQDAEGRACLQQLAQCLALHWGFGTLRACSILPPACYVASNKSFAL